MLKRKLWRDIKDNYGAYLACISVLVIGLMLYVSMALTLESVSGSQEKYYRDYNFADGFAQIVKGPSGLAEDISKIEGIDTAIGRVVQGVLVYKPTGDDNTTVRLISFNPEKQTVNGFKLESGRIPADGEKELLVSPAFLNANGYSLGDQLPLVIQGKVINFTISGTGNSPEYIYEIPGGQVLFPDPKAFGFAFAPYSTVAPLLGMEGQINDIAFTLEGKTEFSQVKSPVTKLLKHYGLSQTYPRKDQLSHSMLSQEIVQLEGSVNTTPVIFLLVAASILYIMLRRMVEQQRGQIGILKAFGFTDWEIVAHYLGYAALIGTVGGISGGLAGIGLSYTLANLYQQYYNIPGLTGKFSLSHLLIGTALSLIFSIFAGYQGCKGVLALSPSEAMRAPAPKVGGKTLLERINFIWKLLNSQGKMAVRNVFRSKARSTLAILGIASAFSMMVASGAVFDAMYYLINFQYEQVERYDMKISLRNYTGTTEAVTSAKNLDGVTGAEPILEVPVTMSNRWLKKDIAITGLPGDASLYRLLTDKGEEVKLPGDGLIISVQLAKALDIKAGDKINVKPFVGDIDERKVLVRAIVPQYVGLGAYMEIDTLSSLLGMSPGASSLLVKVNKDELPEIRKELQKGTNISAIHDKNKMKAQFEDLMESSKAQQLILLSFSFVMGFAIVYNVSIISFSERERELATLMVMGMTEKEVGKILIFEQGLLGLAAVFVGIPMGYGMLYAMITASGNEIFNMPLIVKPTSFMIALLGTLLFLVAAQWKMKGKISKLSMLDVLKEQD